MKKIVLFLVISFTFFSSFAQTPYQALFNQGLRQEKQGHYYEAIKSYTAALAFADSKNRRENIQGRINFCANQLYKLRKKMERAINLAQVFQKKMEEAVFDKSVKERFPDWLGYERYDWNDRSNETTKKGLEILQEIDSLDLSYNALLRVPEQIAQCPNLKHLNLLGNPDIDWKQAFSIISKTNINSVYVSVNDLSDIDSSYWGYIKGVAIVNKGVNKIPKNIMRLKELVYLNISGNKEKNNYIDSNQLYLLFNDLKKIKILKLEYCNLNYIPHNIKNLKDLKKFFLSWNNLTEIPNEICQLKNLIYIDLKHNKIKKLPINFNQLKIEHLDISYNNFYLFPKQICYNQNLKYLNISNNHITTIPPECSISKNLTYLNLANNQIKKISLQNTKLIYLNLSYNQINRFPNLKLKNLKEMYLRSNSIEILPEEINFLKNLEILDLYGNNIQFVNPKIKNLNNLKFLDLRWNNLSEKEKKKLQYLLPNCKIIFSD